MNAVNLALLAAALLTPPEPKPDLVLRGHKGKVSELVFSRDGAWLASYAAGKDKGGELMVWSVRTGKRSVTLDSRSPVDCLWLGPGGRQLAAWDRQSGDGKVLLWDVPTGRRPSLRLPGPCVDVEFVPGGRSVLTLTTNHPKDITGRLLLWDARTGRQQVCLAAHQTGVTSVYASPSGRLLALGADSAVRVSLWDLTSGKALGQLVGVRAAPNRMAFSPDEKTLAVVCYGQGHLDLYELATRKRRATFALPGAGPGGKLDVPHCVAFSGDGRFLTASHASGSLAVWECQTGRLRCTLRGEARDDSWVTFGAGGRALIHFSLGEAPGSGKQQGAHRQKNTAIYDLPAGKLVAVVSEGVGGRTVISVTGNAIARPEPDGTISVWQVARLLRRRPPPGGRRP
jgi:WD40 repeat protein